MFWRTVDKMTFGELLRCYNAEAETYTERINTLLLMITREGGH